MSRVHPLHHLCILCILASLFGGCLHVQVDDAPAKHSRNVSATARQSDSNIIVTYEGGPGSSQVSSIRIIYPDGFTYQVPYPRAGYEARADNMGTSGHDLVVVIARFEDGTEQTILETYV